MVRYEIVFADTSKNESKIRSAGNIQHDIFEIEKINSVRPLLIHENPFQWDTTTTELAPTVEGPVIQLKVIRITCQHDHHQSIESPLGLKRLWSRCWLCVPRGG